MSRPALTKIYTLLLGTAAAVVALDQITKTLAVDALKDGPVEVVTGAVTLRLTYNSGGAFGVLQGLPALFMIATVIVVPSVPASIDAELSIAANEPYSGGVTLR